MIDDHGAKALTVPSSVARAHEHALDLGWDAALTFAAGPPASVALRVQRGRTRAYALWHLTDNRAKWVTAGANRIPGGRLRTATAFRELLTAEGDSQQLQMVA